MKRKILGVVVVVVAAGLTSVGLIHSAARRQPFNQHEKRGTFKERLQHAKERGAKKLRSGAVIPLYAQVDLDGALEIYDLVIGEFVSSKSFSIDDDGHIVTWSRFRVHDTLSKASRPISQIDSPPAELYPLANDEMLVWKTGGTVEIDGLEIEMEEIGFPPFEKSKKYLLFLAVDPAKRAAHVEVGPSGALMINAEDMFEPVNKNTTYFKRELENRYGASISKLKEKLK